MSGVEIVNEVGWCVAVIRNAGSCARRKFRRWQVEQPSDEIETTHTRCDQSFDHAEWLMIIGSLSPRERDIIYRAYVLDQTQQEIAASLHISQQHVSRLKSQGLKRLREVFELEVSSGLYKGDRVHV